MLRLPAQESFDVDSRLIGEEALRIRRVLDRPFLMGTLLD
jgi:hypothetical protein